MTTEIRTAKNSILGIEAKIIDGYLVAPDGQKFKVFKPRKKIAGLGGRVTMIQIVDHVGRLFQLGNNGESIANLCGFKDSDVVSKYKKMAMAYGLDELEISNGREINLENPEYKDADFEKFMQVKEKYNGTEHYTMQEFYKKMYDGFILRKKNVGDKFGATRKARKACRGVFQFCKRLNRTPHALVNPELFYTQGMEAWKNYMKEMLLTADNSDGKSCKEFIMTQHATDSGNYKGGEGAYYSATKWLRHFIMQKVSLNKGDPDLIGWLDNSTISTHGDRSAWRLEDPQIEDFCKYFFGDKNSVKFPYPKLMDETRAAVILGFMGFRTGERFACKMSSWSIETDPEDNSQTIIGRKILSHKNKGKSSGSMFMDKIAYDGDFYILKKSREYIIDRLAKNEFAFIGAKNQFVAPASKADIANGTFHHYDATTFRGRHYEIRKVMANIRCIYEKMGLPIDRSENPLHAMRHFAIQFWLLRFDFDYDLVAEMFNYEHNGVVNTTELRKSYGRAPAYRLDRKVKFLLSQKHDSSKPTNADKA